MIIYSKLENGKKVLYERVIDGEDVKLTYVDEVKNGIDTLGTIKVDREGTVVYDLRNGFEEVKFDSFDSAKLVGSLVIPFWTSECDDGATANILVIVK